MSNALIYGKDNTERVVSVEVKDGVAEIFTEQPDGTVASTCVPHKYWILYSEQRSSKFARLDGELHYKYSMEYSDLEEYQAIIKHSYSKRYDFYTARDPKTNFLIKSGVTSFKGLKVENVSVLSFDIETTGLSPNADDARVLLITNTFRRNGEIERRLFCIDEYTDEATMISEWCRWVRKKNPSIMIGHNVFGFDFPYLHIRGGGLDLGRDGSRMVISDKTRQFRKDGSQTYDYNDVLIYGREIIDTKFLAIKYDIAREFPNYSLKPIIAHLGLEKKGRTFIDASKMKELWADPEMRKLIKIYGEEDADDALKLYDKMVPAFFFYAQHIPMSFQQINNTATGTQLNNFMVRAYLQDGHSIPKADDAPKFPGAISLGVPGIHKNTLKLDISANYPNIMLRWDIFPKHKDPKGYMPKALEHFLNSRLEFKALFKKTGDEAHEGRSNAGKIVANSYYGFAGAQGLNFNFPEGAKKVTALGRIILKCGIYWATGKEMELNGVSEDSEEPQFHAS
jgi:DNA polymerase I